MCSGEFVVVALAMQTSDLLSDSENRARARPRVNESDPVRRTLNRERISGLMNKCPLARYVISQSFQSTISNLPKGNSNIIHHFGITPPLHTTNVLQQPLQRPILDPTPLSLPHRPPVPLIQPQPYQFRIQIPHVVLRNHHKRLRTQSGAFARTRRRPRFTGRALRIRSARRGGGG